ncbi:GTPase ObgE [Atopobacter sp. AH10]|uniref:GTPase ObgE n=1 Tax=Atopobacter sp. AH10 TaxID=2315861 RepID=UPI000EF1896C|nr:GTPase ObgE [Atopobacter sp. AH10]RLK62502.1 GTPase ObgE [Atopobacter sp. AH10]
MSFFYDRAKVFVRGGKGGDGMVAFRREKYVPDGGPAGGDGGRGGDVVFRVDDGLRTLLDFRFNPHFYADAGENGKSKSMYGRGADDLVVRVPAGTIVKREETGEVIADLTEHGQSVVVAKGGRGGRGNKRFATHANPAPAIAENGEPGEEWTLILELKLIADVGLVGFPSVGKSTLLSVVSAAKPKIADYPFTTLTPQLGMVEVAPGESFVMADLPGLIEGASEGVGLGMQFLRHVERCLLLVHVLDMSGQSSRDPFHDYQVILKELGKYHEKLLKRPMIILANKMETPEAPETLKVFKDKFKDCYGYEAEVFEASTYKKQGIKAFIEAVYKSLKEAEFVPLEEEKVNEARLYQIEDDLPFTIHRESDGSFVLSGQKIEKLYAMTNFNHDESIRRFSRQLRGMGVDDALREKGARNGDLVHLVDFTFEFLD